MKKDYLGGRPIPVEYEPMRKNRTIIHFKDQSFFTKTNTICKSHSTLFKEIELVLSDLSPIGKDSDFTELVRWGSKKPSSLYKKDISLELLDPTGVSVESWTLHGCSIKSTNIDFNFNSKKIQPIGIQVILNIDKISPKDSDIKIAV